MKNGYIFALKYVNFICLKLCNDTFGVDPSDAMIHLAVTVVLVDKALDFFF